MMEQPDIYFRFLQFSLGLRDGREFLSGEALEGLDWTAFFEFAQAQTLTGILFDGIRQLPKEAAPPQHLLFRWLGQGEALRKRNLMMNRATAYIYNKVSAAGFRCCILKGQGNSLMYPNPHARTSGDVDVWVNASRKDIRSLASVLAADEGTVGEESLNHIEMTVRGVGVELHSTPAILNNPVHNHRLQAWIRRNADLQCSHVVTLPDGAGEVAVPTNVFNAVYQLFHLYHHYFYEGVGLRQIVDYYFVVKSLDMAPVVLQHDLEHLGLWKFAGAVMYVLHEVMGLREEEMIAPMDVKRGRLLLQDILRGGNFGQHGGKSHGGSMTWWHNIRRIQRDWRLMGYYPAEALAEPLFRLGHFWWRLGNNDSVSR